MKYLWRSGLALLIWLISTPLVWADPTIDVPPVGRGVLSVDADEQVELALVGEVAIIAVVGAEPETEHPEIDGVEGGRPELAVARVGLTGTRSSWSYSVRLDFSEGLRVTADDFRDRPVAALDRFIDDAALWWRPRSWANFVLGRFKVPFSRLRQLERTRLSAASVPFVSDRVAPDRRWGTTVYGDLGALAYAVGGYADFDALEMRRPSYDLQTNDPPISARVDDPSTSGRLLATAYLWWTPRGPIGDDHLATPATDPWYRTMRPAGGIGLMYRERRGADRLDVSIAGQIKYRNLAAVGELYAFSADGALGMSGAASGSALLTRRFALFARADIDAELDIWSAGGGLSYFATADRRNKLTFIGWVRRDTYGGPKRDGAIVLLQAAL